MLNVVLQLWSLPNLTLNLVDLVPKFPKANLVDKFWPIALVNFQFKVITKVLANRLAMVAPKIISQQQWGFIVGRHIGDCICVASKVINMLKYRTFGGKLTLMFDICKVFVTLDWKILIEVLSAFGFDKKFIRWIYTILLSTKLSYFVNGKAMQFCSCKRGVRQGDPMSSLMGFS